MTPNVKKKKKLKWNSKRKEKKNEEVEMQEINCWKCKDWKISQR